MIKNSIVIVLVVFFVFTVSSVFAQEAGEVGRVGSSEQQIEKEKELRQRIEKKEEVPLIEEEKPVEKPVAPAGAEKAMITNIKVSGVTLFSADQINAIISPFQGKELTLADMQKVADLITDLYRQKGYVTSRAYLPPQKIETGTLEIRVIEGTTGEIEVKGNHFFRSSRLIQGLRVYRGERFNYNVLRKNLAKINEHPDRNVKAVLVPGKEVGSTDIVLEVKDRLPLHAEISWDNFGSRYIRKNHYNTVLSHNNLLGFDDIFSLQYQISDAQDYKLVSMRYLFPVTSKLKLGAFGYYSTLSLGREYKEVMARSKSRMYSLYAMYDLVTQENLSIALNMGFDYKDNYNFQLAEEESRDRLRVAKVGFDIDSTDAFKGRTIFSPEMDFGIPNIMAGLKSIDPHASRSGAGGNFVKSVFNVLRLQKMPFDSVLLWKNQAQVSPYILTATEQFQLGGIANNRGYPAGEYVGDEGYATSWEWSFPLYGLPKNMMVPFTKEKIYDSLKWVIFYDWGFTHLQRPQAGEEETKTLRSIGCGIRFTLPKNLSLRFDFGWPLDKTPSDSNHFHPWVQIIKEF